MRQRHRASPGGIDAGWRIVNARRVPGPQAIRGGLVSAPLAAVLNRIESRRAAALAELSEFLRFPSVSADPARATDVRACADWLAARVSAPGLTAEVLPTARHPIVLAKNQHCPDRPTILLYGHYDVQPPDPLDRCTTPPFVPTVRE